MRPDRRDAALRMRAAAPMPLVGVGRRAYRAVATMTAPLRLEPGFLLIGAQRCGTTSLFRALSQHPGVLAPTFRKGVNYFDLNYYRGAAWYRGQFPIAPLARWNRGGRGKPVAFEASGYYLYHPFAIERLARDLPAAKLVVMLRDPVERAFSAYKHESARGYERESFEEALALEDSRLAGEVDRMREDPTYESLAHRHHSYRHRGHYAEQLERVYSFFPREQVHVLESEDWFDEPERESDRLLAFLGLEPFRPVFGRHNARPGEPMAAATRRSLAEYFAPYNEKLADVLGRRPRWVE